MRIAIIGQRAFSQEVRYLKLTSSLISAGFEVFVYSPEKGAGFVKKMLVFGQNEYRLKNRFIRGIYVLGCQFVNLVTVFFTALRIKADIFQAYEPYSLLPVTLAGSLRRKKVIYDSRELYSEYKQGGNTWQDFANRMIVLVERFCLPRLECVITINELYLKELEKKYQMKRSCIIRNCPPYQELDPVPKTKTFDTKKNEAVIIYAGAIRQDRGIGEIVALLPYLDNSIVLALIGFYQGGYLDHLLGQLPEEQKTRIRFLGKLPYSELFNVMAAADLGLFIINPVSLHYYYTSPNKLFDYMMAGLPVAVSDLPYLSRIVTEEQCGLTVDPVKPEEAASAINRFLLDKPKRDAAAANARRAAVEKYNWENEFKKYLEVVLAAEGVR